MFRNYLISAVRNFQRRKQYALLSIFVMVIGLTTATLTLLYARYEFSYENWISNSDNIYRVELTYHFPGAEENQFRSISLLYGPALAKDFSEIESFTRAVQFPGTSVRYGENEFTEDNVVNVDKNYLEFFEIDLLEGEKNSILSDLNSILLSEKTAKKYFGSSDPIGQVLSINNFRDHKVVGIFKDLPENTHLAIDFLVLYDESMFTPFTNDFSFARQWNSGLASTYFKLKEGAKIAQITSRLDSFTNDNYVHPNPVRTVMTPTDFVHTRVRSIEDIHLFSENLDEIKPSSTMSTVLGLVAIAGLILSAVVVNYINLATAVSTLRAREIGLRKTVGAKKQQIRVQFIIEATFLALLALIFSFAATELALPFFTQTLNLSSGTLQLFGEPMTVFYLLLIGLGLGLISGIYPAFFLSKIKPVEVLSANTPAGSISSRFRSFLVTLQFSISVGLIISIYMVFSQTEFVSQMDIGAETENITVFGAFTTQAQAARPTLIAEIRNIPGVLAVGASSTVPTNGGPISTAVEIPGGGNEDALSAWYASVDEGFFEVYGLKTLAGRLFSENFPADRIVQLPDDMSGFEGNILVNEKSLGFLGFENPDQAIGQRFRLGGSNFNNSLMDVTIVGVISDFQFGSAYDAVQPTFFIQREDQFFQLSVHTTPEAFFMVQQKIDEIWLRVMPEETIIRTNMNEMIAAQYDIVNRQGTILVLLSLIAIVISSLGILGMASFSVERKRLEIGIRKVFGAQVRDIVGLLLIQFSKPVIWGNLLAWPIAYYFVRDWLDGFIYRISFTPMPFILAGLASLLIAWGVVSFYAFKAASANPIKALRYE